MRMADRPGAGEFEGFAARVQPRLLRALVATYGPVLGREATADALAWAWEHWDRASGLAHPVGYLYRVGQTAARRQAPKPVPPELLVQIEQRFPEIEPSLIPALDRLTEQQRTVVVLVHAFGWTQADVSDLLEVSPSTVADHLRRAISHLRSELEVTDAHQR